MTLQQDLADEIKAQALEVWQHTSNTVPKHWISSVMLQTETVPLIIQKCHITQILQKCHIRCSSNRNNLTILLGCITHMLCFNVAYWLLLQILQCSLVGVLWLNQMWALWGSRLVHAKKPCTIWRSKSPRVRALLRRNMCQPIVAYLQMSSSPASACSG